MGVMNRKIGRLNMSMVGMIPVKTMPAAAKAMPPRKATGRMSSPCGNATNPNGVSTASMSPAAAVDLMAA